MSGRQGRCSLKRKTKKARRNPARHVLTGIKVLVSLVILGALSLMASSLYDYIIRLPQVQLSRVSISGTNQANPMDIEGIVRACSPECLLLADLDKIKESVETLPWIAEVIVKKRLPDTMVIEVRERQPIAVAGVDSNLHIVDSQGIILDPFNGHHDLLKKPIVRGLKNQLRENADEFNRIRMKKYLEVLADFSQGNRDYSEAVSEIDVTDPGHVSVIPKEDPVIIYLGDKSFRERFESFLSRKQLYYQIKKQYGVLQYIDISFDKQIIFRTEKEDISG